MKHTLLLVRLNEDQIARAKEVNGARKGITHALICGPYGQIFGTEKQCLKYFMAWSPTYYWPGKLGAIFPNLFDKEKRTKKHKITNYETTFDLVEKLIEANEKPSKRR